VFRVFVGEPLGTLFLETFWSSLREFFFPENFVCYWRFVAKSFSWGFKGKDCLVFFQPFCHHIWYNGFLPSPFWFRPLGWTILISVWVSHVWFLHCLCALFLCFVIHLFCWKLHASATEEQTFPQIFHH